MRERIKIMSIAGLLVIMLAGCGDEGGVSAEADTTEFAVTESVVSTEVAEVFEANEYEELDYERCFRLEKKEAGSKVCARGYLTQSLGDDEYVMEDDEGRQMMFLDARENKDVRFMVGMRLLLMAFMSRS